MKRELPVAPYETPRERLLGVFDMLGERVAEPGFLGCAFLRASAELRPGSAVRDVCDDARAWMRDLFIDLGFPRC